MSLTSYQWITFGALAATALFILPLARLLLHRSCENISRRRHRVNVVQFLPWPLMWVGECFIAGAMFFLLQNYLNAPTRKLTFYGLFGITLLSVMWLAWRIGDIIRRQCMQPVERISTLAPPEGRDDFAVAAALISRVFKMALMGLALLVVLSIVGVPASPLLAALSVAMLSLGLAFQPAAESVVGTVTMLATRPYTIGDLVVINNVEGFVQTIDTFATVLRGWDGNMHTLPNALLLKSGVTNTWRRHFTLCSFSLEVKTILPPEWGSAQTFLARAREYISQHPDIVPDNPEHMVFFIDPTGYSITLYFYFYMNVGPLSRENPQSPPTAAYWGIIKNKKSIIFQELLSLGHQLRVTFYERPFAAAH